MPVIFQDKNFVCHTLEQIMLSSKNEKWSIIIGGKTLDNTGLQKRNKIRKINWNAQNDWDGNPLFESENVQPDMIQEVPGKSSYLYVWQLFYLMIELFKLL